VRRACAQCEKDAGVLNRGDADVTHGMCKKHFVATLLQGGVGWDEIKAEVAAMKPDAFCDEIKKTKPA
jgi:hypothetical protein